MSAEPIISGFYPDPSVCRVGADIYLANSSFEYVPGVPIWHTTDLLHWSQAGNALTRPSQLTPSAGNASTGIYAPTLRHHDGRFWLVTTNVAEVQNGHQIMWAEDPAGPWSDPVHTTGTIGIDPDLCWDENDVCHLTWASAWPEDLRGIASVPIDPATGDLLEAPRLLWPGSGLAYAEGPHLYRRNGWWYLLLAEGGTERGHAVTIARSRSLDDGWEACPHNPILSHRSTASPVQNTGHADLVELADGSWAMVYLGVRPRGQTPQFHTNGRETFLAGIDWIDEWPVIDEDRYPVAPVDRSFTDRFGDVRLHPRWVSPGEAPDRFVTPTDHGLTLAADSTDPAPRLLACRATDPEWTAQATIDASRGTARFVVRIDDTHYYGMTVGPATVRAALRIGPAETTDPQIPLGPSSTATLRIAARTPHGEQMRPANEPDLITLAVVDSDGTEHRLGEFDGRYLSTEVAGGFTGRVIGIEVVDGVVDLSEFSYTSVGVGQEMSPNAAPDRSRTQHIEGELITHD